MSEATTVKAEDQEPLISSPMLIILETHTEELQEEPDIDEVREQFKREWPAAKVIILPRGIHLKTLVSREE